MSSLHFLFITAFLGQMASGIVGITIPIYANSLGASPFLLGVIGAAGGLIYSITPLVFGMLSDRSSRKIFIVVSMAGSALSYLLYSLSQESTMLIFIKVLESLSSAIFWPSVEAIISDSSEGKLEKALERFNISWGSAMVIGPMIGGALISWYSLKAPFLVSIIIVVLVGSFSLLLVKELPRRTKGDVLEELKSNDKTAVHGSLVTPLSSILLFAFIGGIIGSLFPAYAINLGIPAYEVGLIMLVLGAARVITFHQNKKIKGGLGRIRMFMAGSLTSFIALFVIANSYTTFMFVTGFMILGVSSSISYASSLSYILERWRSSRGYAAGLFESLIGAGNFSGSLVGGGISQIMLNAPYTFCWILSLVVFFVQLFQNRDSSQYT